VSLQETSSMTCAITKLKGYAAQFVTPTKIPSLFVFYVQSLAPN
jgi:hypothetical protein